MKKIACITLLAALLACAVPLAAQSKEALSPEAFLQMGHSESIIAVAYSPDGRRIASASFDNTVKIWDVESGRELHTLVGHGGIVYSVNYSPDGRRIVSGSSDEIIKIWDAETGREIGTLAGHSNNVRSVTYSPDGRYIVSGSSDRTLKIWNVETGQEIRTLVGHSGSVISVAYSPDGRRIVSGSFDKVLKVWDTETGGELKTIPGHEERVVFVSYSPDGKRIVSTTNQREIKIWDAETGRELRAISADVSVHSARFSPDGGRILCGSGDDTVKIFDAATGREIRSLAGHGGAVFAVSYSPDGRRILSGSGDNTAKIWDAATGAEIMTLGIPVPLIRDMIAEYLALAGDSAAKTGAFSGPSLYRAGPRETALQFGALVSKTLAETRFLDPQNSAALRRCEALLQSVAGKGGVSRAEMQRYLKQGIAAVVREEFNEVSFYLQKYSGGFNATLGRDPKTEKYTLTYWGHYTGNVVKTISGSGLDDLLAAMKNNPDFDVMGIDLVKEKAGHIPAVVYGEWLSKGQTTVDAVKLAADTVAGFYLNPTQENYNLLASVYGQFRRERNVQDPVAEAGREAYDNLLSDLNKAIRDRAYDDNILRGAALAQAARARNPDYGVFAKPYKG